jgi:hypothetical protein
MALSRRERFRMKTSIIDEMNDSHLDWNWERKNILLGEFDIGPLEDSYNGAPSFEELIAGLSDQDLMEMYSIVTGEELSEVQNAVESSADAGNWKTGYVRLFISHSALHKEFVGDVANELAVVGIHGFVAHDTMAVSKPWQKQIEQALRSMEAFVALVHPEFNDSAWCQQEVGWAFGRRVPKYAVRMGNDPVGFIGSDQWHSGASMRPTEVAELITAWIAEIPELGDRMVNGLFTALSGARNYQDAGATARRIATLGSLTDEQWTRLHDIWWSNDQLYGGALPTKALRPFYSEHGRGWPPPKPLPPVPPNDPGASGGDEAPF